MFIEIILVSAVIALALEQRKIVMMQNESSKNQKIINDNQEKIAKKINFIGVDLIDEIRERVDENRDVMVALLKHSKLNAEQKDGEENWEIIKIKKNRNIKSKK